MITATVMPLLATAPGSGDLAPVRMREWRNATALEGSKFRVRFESGDRLSLAESFNAKKRFTEYWTSRRLRLDKAFFRTDPLRFWNAESVEAYFTVPAINANALPPSGKLGDLLDPILPLFLDTGRRTTWTVTEVWQLPTDFVPPSNVELVVGDLVDEAKDTANAVADAAGGVKDAVTPGLFGKTLILVGLLVVGLYFVNRFLGR